ncbi:FdhF/YdeP family oxidoreductase [Myceligenerans xiligouense]|uniref:Molybdopterin-dependent oxidoreductase alpha subunit n=1 Tax=Myceligenerans xiligouense TaxID=253184 RepID=A0A3N4YP27_9MICO|nr:FdhF/YdeP family oxidoreductase [Myceligenerans xiligouense]RPF22373.1 molybdopterin-dependent oxidoreductase alpha subunit [Myceligenerans xiligouense]
MSDDARTGSPEPTLDVGPPQRTAAGVAGVVHAMADVVEEPGLARGLKALRLVNQHRGFDCPGCAWPEPGKPHLAEFCENGAKAVAEESTRARADAAFFAEHPLGELATWTDHRLGKSGRLTEPMLRDTDADHYRPVSWDDALDLVAGELRALREAGTPDRAAFYTSGRTSNEAAFLYQLLARRLGTNNLPDCSNMCHESSGTALVETLGVGKGSVSLADITDHADLIVVVGQNPGTNHPRMLTALEAAKDRGARIVAINPLPEAGLRTFKNPQRVRGTLGRGTRLADRFLQVRLAGDLALFQAVNRLLVERDDGASAGRDAAGPTGPGTATDSAGAGSRPPVLDHDFIAAHTDGFEAAAAAWRALSWSDVGTATGLDRSEIEGFVDDVVGARKIVVCWAMGLTQHKKAVATIREVVNFLLLRGNVGRPGAGACPVRGHSNVQGDRTMGIWERPPAAFLDALGAEFRFDPPREPGLDTVDTVRAMRDGRIRVFMAMGGNFAAATPDTELTEAALRRVPLTVHVSTKLNRSHVVPGRRSLILPCLGRTERDDGAGRSGNAHAGTAGSLSATGPGGDALSSGTATGPRFVTVEDSMSVVHSSRGTLRPASDMLWSEPAIVAGLARRVLGDDDPTPWESFAADYSRIRDSISRVVPGFEDFERRVAEPGGFVLPHPPRDARVFPTATGKARFTVNPLEVVRVPEGRLLLQSVRSHDQFNTTIYGQDDRYRGVTGGRRVVFVNPRDLEELGVADGETVNLVSEWPDGEGGTADRRAPGFRVIAFPTAKGCAAAYYPETNVLVPLDHTAEGSNTPASKSVVIRLER